MIHVLQIGIGPLGLKTYSYISQREKLKTVAAVDINSQLEGKDLGILSGHEANGVHVRTSLSKVDNIDDVDVVVLTTSSSVKSIAPQLEEIATYGKPIVTTCEELSYPWKSDSQLSNHLDDIAKANKVSIVSTGVNPGFLMDSLPSFLSSVCQRVDHIEVRRIQDASSRRVPFQQKIGAGLSLEEFEMKKSNGTLRHVGLTESMQFIADAVGWTIDHTEDVISPIIAEEPQMLDHLKIEKGMAQGVKQIGRASFEGVEKVKLVFEAAIGTGVSYDEIKITGEPNISSRIDGGVNGDIATCSIILNAIPSLLKATPGLKTMRDLSLVSYFG